MRVASSLDSLVLGEAQILGQVRSALMAAHEAGTAGGILTGLFQNAILCGRRVQTETALGRGAFSIGRAAVDLARSIFTDLSHASALVVGAGEMSEITVRHLVESGVRVVIVANRTFEKAEAMAERFGGTAIQYDRFVEQMATADIVIASTAAPHYILRREMLAPVLRKRRGRPLFLIDIAVPRDIDPDVDRLENVFLKNIDDLQEFVASDAGERVAESRQAAWIAEEETAKFFAWYRAREVAPVLGEIRRKLEEIRRSDMDILRSKLGHLSDREWEAIESTTRAMMNHVAREPVLRLKREAGERTGAASTPAGYDLVAAAREIFGIGPDGASEADSAHGADTIGPEATDTPSGPTTARAPGEIPADVEAPALGQVPLEGTR
jgi:glutamyl-tRNA reductase